MQGLSGSVDEGTIAAISRASSRTPRRSVWVSIDEAIRTFARGGMVVLVDDPDRENEGDVCIPAAAITAQHVNFLITHCRGLVCLAMAPAQCDQLALPMMVEHPTEAYGTPFTVSIEAASGVTTGISAADRAHTIRVAADPLSVPTDLVQPGHIFPLRARPGGVLERNGHTEASVDLARLAGLAPSSVICEILNEDGSMARVPDLERFCRTHDLTMASIADLVAWRARRATAGWNASTTLGARVV
ncbi:MAG: 3,4-dihydroxy-2-butanone-4-phosphate synthase [Thermoleophilia bacterium]|nr:3,4-dihydroxy-2-butanone-4-phosphate synthase [Thermoleophilia bacterium]